MFSRALTAASQRGKLVANTRIGFALMNAADTLNSRDNTAQVQRMQELAPQSAPAAERFSLLGGLCNMAKNVFRLDSRHGGGLDTHFADQPSNRLGIHFVDQKISRGDVYHNDQLREFIFSTLEPSDEPIRVRSAPGRVTEKDAVYMHQMCTSMTSLPSGSFIGLVGIVDPEEHQSSLRSVGYSRDHVEFYELARPEVEGLVALVGSENEEGSVTIVPHCSPEQMRAMADAALMACAAEHAVVGTLLQSLGEEDAVTMEMGMLEGVERCAERVEETLEAVRQAVIETRQAHPEDFQVPMFTVPLENSLQAMAGCVRREAQAQIENHAFQLGFARSLYEASGLEPSNPMIGEILDVAEREQARLRDFRVADSLQPEHAARMAAIEEERERRVNSPSK